MFDEPSSYLDVKQRLKAAQVIRSLAAADTYVVACISLHSVIVSCPVMGG